MINIWPFKSKDLRTHLSSVKTVKISGILFKIKKVDMMNYLDGSKILLKIYDTYSMHKDSAVSNNHMEKVKKHYTDIFMAGVVHPKLSRKDEGESIYVGELFKDWSMAETLYEEIVKLTYPKKKLI